MDQTQTRREDLGVHMIDGNGKFSFQRANEDYQRPEAAFYKIFWALETNPEIPTVRTIPPRVSGRKTRPMRWKFLSGAFMLMRTEKPLDESWRA